MAYKVTSASADPSRLVEALKKIGYRYRPDTDGVCYLPAGHGYGDAEDIETDLQRELPGESISVTREEDPVTDPHYHN